MLRLCKLKSPVFPIGVQLEGCREILGKVTGTEEVRCSGILVTRSCWLEQCLRETMAKKMGKTFILVQRCHGNLEVQSSQLIIPNVLTLFLESHHFSPHSPDGSTGRMHLQHLCSYWTSYLNPGPDTH